jgi:hypothetical protein
VKKLINSHKDVGQTCQTPCHLGSNLGQSVAEGTGKLVNPLYQKTSQNAQLVE